MCTNGSLWGGFCFNNDIFFILLCNISTPSWVGGGYCQVGGGTTFTPTKWYILGFLIQYVTSLSSLLSPVFLPIEFQSFLPKTHFLDILEISSLHTGIYMSYHFVAVIDLLLGLFPVQKFMRKCLWEVQFYHGWATCKCSHGK